MYQTVWRCKLCGQRFIGEVALDEDDVNKPMSDTIFNLNVLPTMHKCYGGSLGIADFQGFEHYEDKK